MSRVKHCLKQVRRDILPKNQYSSSNRTSAPRASLCSKKCVFKLLMCVSFLSQCLYKYTHQVMSDTNAMSDHKRSKIHRKAVFFCCFVGILWPIYLGRVGARNQYFLHPLKQKFCLGYCTDFYIKHHFSDRRGKQLPMTSHFTAAKSCISLTHLLDSKPT